MTNSLSKSDLRPGQLWQWAAKVGDVAVWWPFQVVEQEFREHFGFGRFVTMNYGDVFTMFVVDDPGPIELTVTSESVPGTNEIILKQNPPKEWSVVLYNDTFIWVQHKHLFESSNLVSDAV